MGPQSKVGVKKRKRPMLRNLDWKRIISGGDRNPKLHLGITNPGPLLRTIDPEALLRVNRISGPQEGLTLTLPWTLQGHKF